MSIEARLRELGVELAAPPAPAANYVPAVRSGNVLYVSGQISMDASGQIRGRLGEDMDVEAGARAARACAVALLAQVKAACDGDIERLRRVVKLTGFVNSTPEFGDQPKVVNGASDFLVEVLGRARAPRALGRLGRRAALRRRRGDRRDLRGRMSPPLPAAFLDPGRIAHRGLHGDGRPENTIAAFDAAAEAGYAIELDVQLSLDGVAMVFHDATLDRMTARSGPVVRLSSSGLRRVAVGGTDQRIPSLRDVLDRIDGRVPVLVELKDQHGAMGEGPGRLERAVAAALGGYRGAVAVMSFNPHSVALLARLRPDTSRGLVTARFDAANWPDLPAETRERLAAIPDAARVGAAFVSHQADALDMPRVAALRAEGLAVLCWTITSAADEARVRPFADAVTFEGYRP